MPDLYAVIGNPIHHSKSPIIHMEFARQTHQDIQYNAILAPLESFAATVSAFQQKGGERFECNTPFQTRSVHFIDSVD